MPRPPKKYYADDQERQRLVDEYSPYFKYPHVPTNAARGIIHALLEQIPLDNLNRDAALGHLMAELLHDNRELEEAKKRSEDHSTEFQTAEENAAAEQLLADLGCESYGPARVTKVLQEYSSHSTDRMREESDEILRALEATPLGNRDRKDWLNSLMPQLLQSLKGRHACFTGCRANSEWPPMKSGASALTTIDNDTIDQIVTPRKEAGTGLPFIKNEILAYFHGLDADSVRRYLEGKRPKTVSRSSRPRT